MSGDLNNITAALLVGGLGTRLRTVVSDRPKVMAEVRGRPFLEYLLDKLLYSGINHVVLCTGYMGEQIKTVFGNSYKNIHLDYSQEAIPSGTAGALRLALPFFKSKDILVMNGDSFCDANLNDFYSFYCARKSNLSIVLTEVENTMRYGRVNTDEQGVIKKFEEKGTVMEPGWINGGIYLLNCHIIQSIPELRAVSLEKEVFPLFTGKDMHGYKSKGKFLDIGTPESYREAEIFFCTK